jgi:hypothetical protein
MYCYDGEHKESHSLMVQKNIQEVAQTESGKTAIKIVEMTKEK